MPNSQLRFEDIKIHGSKKTHEKSTFLGYASATLVVEGVLPEGDDLKLRIHGIQLKVVNRSFRFDVQSKGSDNVWRDIVAPHSKQTRTALTKALLVAYNEYLASMRVAA